ncbi:hypothetical protein [Planobispora rosea]|nr:hypothetical protein [Planobispora rosea]
MRQLRRGLLAVILSLGIVAVMSAPAQAEKLGPRPNWGACGTSTSEYKMVYDFGGINLKCGNASWGYRHIKDRHYNEFQNLARAGGLNWSDLVHWVIHYNVQDPDHVIVDQGDGCRDRMLYLHDRNGRLVWQQRFKVIYSAMDGRVITAYPSSAICVR